jgi:hypothetical protein
MKKIQILMIILMSFMFVSGSVYAVRSRTRQSPTTKTVTTGSVYTTVKFRADRKAVIINFSNMNVANSITYTLSYTANGIDQGAQGTITPQGESSTTREVLFGTCSKNVCTYHYNIVNAKLEIRSKLKNGTTTLKTYRLKV